MASEQTTLRILESAYEIVSDRERWTTGVLTNVHEQYCALGAVMRAAGWSYDGIFEKSWYDMRLIRKDSAVNQAVKALALASETYKSGDPRPYYGHVCATNDQEGHAAVLKMFQRAIRTLKEQEAAQ